MTRFLSRVVLLAGLGAAALAPRTSAAQGFKIVVNSDVQISDIGQTSLSNLFLKKDRKFATGVEAAPVDLSASTAGRDAFSKAVHGRSTSAVVTYWQQQVFSGKDTPPPSKANDDAVVAYVKSTPGGIGYVSEGASTDGVKVIKLK
ncbi:phosphate ABC transporter substrate-binding protein [Gemmatimonas sp.]|uniref:phosphate ABC transporter substrate-binding protein n=1 Tax=Gemmatimonas sp. TaxID=1962908 RepID=UPI0039835C11